jgi:hypothetical protein
VWVASFPSHLDVLSSAPSTSPTLLVDGMTPIVVGSLSLSIGLVCWIGPCSSSSASCLFGSHPPSPHCRCGVSLLLLVVVVLEAMLLLLLAVLCCTALFVIVLGWVALVVAVVAMLGALVQLMGCKCRSWGMAVFVGPYVSSKGCMFRRRVLSVVRGCYMLSTGVVDGLYCRSGVCCATCRQ